MKHALLLGLTLALLTLAGAAGAQQDCIEIVQVDFEPAEMVVMVKNTCAANSGLLAVDAEYSVASGPSKQSRGIRFSLAPGATKAQLLKRLHLPGATQLRVTVRRGTVVVAEKIFGPAEFNRPEQ